jgi:hypothetical protein
MGIVSILYMRTHNKAKQQGRTYVRPCLRRYVTSTDIYTNNGIRCKVVEFIFTNLGINNYDKPTDAEILLDYIDA